MQEADGGITLDVGEGDTSNGGDLSGSAGATTAKSMEWLLTCPVILIHLSNITGLNDEYSGRTMSLLTSDLGGIAFAVLSALAVGWQKVGL